MKFWIGKSVIVIGIVHSVFGFIAFRGVLSELGKELLLNTVDGQPDREAAFWFLFTGFTLLGCFIMPKSGFWLLFVPTVGMYLHQNTVSSITSHL